MNREDRVVEPALEMLPAEEPAAEELAIELALERLPAV